MEPVLLRTARLLLRDYLPDDRVALHPIMADPAVVRHVAWGPNSEAETRAFVRECIAAARLQQRRVYELAVVRVEDGAVLGSTRLEIVGPRGVKGELGYWLRPEAWGQGYATELGEALLRFAFETLGLHRVFATCDTRNRGSWHVMEKLGMQREGEMRQDVWLRDHWRDSYLYAVLADEWRAAHSESAR